jgi:hypothetical protein
MNMVLAFNVRSLAVNQSLLADAVVSELKNTQGLVRHDCGEEGTITQTNHRCIKEGITRLRDLHDRTKQK